MVARQLSFFNSHGSFYRRNLRLRSVSKQAGLREAYDDLLAVSLKSYSLLMRQNVLRSSSLLYMLAHPQMKFSFEPTLRNLKTDSRLSPVLAQTRTRNEL